MRLGDLTTLTDQVFIVGTALVSGRAGLFLRVFAAALVYVAAAAAYRRWLSPAARTWALVGTSTVLLGWLATPALAALALAYFVGFFALVERLPRGLARRAALTLAVGLQMAVPIWLVPAPPAVPLLVRELIAFTTNMTQLRCWSYAWDRSHEDGPPPALRDYLHYMTFLPCFVGGPLLSFAEFQRGRLAWYWTAPAPRLTDGFAVERRAFVRIALGGAAALAAIQLTFVLGPRAYQTAATGFVPAWSHALGVYFAVYLGFSAWSEAAIGCGRLAGIVLPENFDHAHLSYGIADFWRRWNIRLGWWMRTYVYLPLGGSRRQLVRNTVAVFLATALYHHVGGLKLLGPALIAWPSFYLGWLGWAFLNTVGTLATRRWTRPDALDPKGVAIIVASFLFSCVALQTAFLPAGLSWGPLAAIYRALVGL